MDNVIMILFVGLLFGIIIWQMKYDVEKKDFLSLSDTTIIKGIFSLVVVLVHIPNMYGNEIQDIIGSFACVGVTFFFLSSAYGLQTSKSKNKNYLNDFWKKRLPKILLPAIIINIILNVLKKIVYNDFSITFLSLININRWVVVLLLFYLIFYIVNKIKISERSKDYLIVTIIVLLSIVDYFTKLKLVASWPTESIGFALGILIYRRKDKILEICKKYYKRNSVLLVICSLIMGLCYLKYKTVFFYGEYVLKIILSIIILITIMQINVKLNLGNKILNFIGKISYEIYLFQYVSFLFLKLLDIKFTSSVYIIIIFIITFIGSYIIKRIDDYILEKIGIL